MAGVAGPMLRRSRSAGVRLLVGLLVGEAAAGVLLAVPAYLLSEAARALLAPGVRLWLLAAVCALLGLADLANRTPHVWRQVPQALVRRLPPGALGVAWGLDLGLLFTTQKVVSLIWVALAAGVLLDPVTAAAVVVGAAVVTGVTVVVASLRFTPRALRRAGATQRRARRASGTVILALFLVTAVQAWHA